MLLEDLMRNNKLQSTLQNKKVGYYFGSFDPFHKGHEEVAKSVLRENLCDYVVIYPAWGGDSYKKRASVDQRLDMLFALFKDHPNIIVTRYPPKELQDALTKKISRKRVEPKFEGLRFFGVVGSDLALNLPPDKATSLEFMSGEVITYEYENYTWDGCIALPVSSFIVCIRIGDDLSPLQGMAGGRKIVSTITLKQYGDVSSTFIKNLIKNQQSTDKWLSEQVIQIIKENKLYQ